MNERPILFSAPMVRMLLPDAKTQTRRIVKDTGLYAVDPVHGADVVARELKCMASQCPYGQPGDRLWVKETWSAAQGWDNCRPLDICCESPIRYAADGATRFVDAWDDYEPRQYGRLRPSIFMRRWMSRITLDITSIRVERLNAISEEDARAEGGPSILGFKDESGQYGFDSYRSWYKWLWESINGPGSWAKNPLVWVVGFRRVP